MNTRPPLWARWLAPLALLLLTLAPTAARLSHAGLLQESGRGVLQLCSLAGLDPAALPDQGGDPATDLPQGHSGCWYCHLGWAPTPWSSQPALPSAPPRPRPFWQATAFQAVATWTPQGPRGPPHRPA